MLRFLGLMLALGLAGCVSAGTQINDQQLTQFKTGETTYEQVIAALGPPTSITTSTDGVRILVYSYVHSQARPETFIPIVGALVGGADAHSDLVMLTFDADDKLKTYTHGTTNVRSVPSL